MKEFNKKLFIFVTEYIGGHVMKNGILIVMLVFLSPIFLHAASDTPSGLSATTSTSDVETYDIVEIYEKMTLKDGSKAMDSYGNIEEAEAVFVPARMDIRKYEVEVTRVDSNFYQICGTDLYIETKYCYEYAVREDAMIVITSNYGYTRGEIIFFE